MDPRDVVSRDAALLGVTARLLSIDGGIGPKTPLCPNRVYCEIRALLRRRLLN